ncbi:hypothetical protein STEG23_002539, partial [Scotinomys teguina]
MSVLRHELEEGGNKHFRISREQTGTNLESDPSHSKSGNLRNLNFNGRCEKMNSQSRLVQQAKCLKSKGKEDIYLDTLFRVHTTCILLSPPKTSLLLPMLPLYFPGFCSYSNCRLMSEDLELGAGGEVCIQNCSPGKENQRSPSPFKKCENFLERRKVLTPKTQQILADMQGLHTFFPSADSYYGNRCGGSSTHNVKLTHGPVTASEHIPPHTPKSAGYGSICTPIFIDKFLSQPSCGFKYYFVEPFCRAILVLMTSKFQLK